MRVVRRAVVFAGVLAFIWGVAQFVLPTTVTAGSGLPGPLDQLAPDSVSNRRLDCGSVADPAEFDSIDDLLRLDCDRALASAQRRGLLLMGASTGTVLLAVMILRDPKNRSQTQQTRSVQSVADTRSDLWSAPVRSPPSVAPRTPVAVAPPDPGARSVVPPVAEGARVTRATPSRFRRPAAVAAGIVVAIAAGIVARSIVAGDDAGGATMPFNGRSEVPVVTIDQFELDCMSGAISDSDTLHDQAQAASQLDRDRAIINLDGDASYLEYAAALDRLDLSDCPTSFQTAFASWVETWRLYGQDLSDGGAEIRDYIAMIQTTDDGVRRSASDAGLDLQLRTWSVSTGD